MPNIKDDTDRKDYRISVKITRESGAFLEKLAVKMHAKGKIKKPRNKNAAVQKAIECAEELQSRLGWDEIVDSYRF